MDFSFETELRVRFSETDAQGVVHNAVYLVWFEIARIEYLARFDGGYPALREQGVDATTVESYVRYAAATRFDERLGLELRDVRRDRLAQGHSQGHEHDPSPAPAHSNTTRLATKTARLPSSDRVCRAPNSTSGTA